MAPTVPPAGTTTLTGSSRLARFGGKGAAIGIIVITLGASAIVGSGAPALLIPIILIGGVIVGFFVFQRSISATIGWKAPTLTLSTGPYSLGSELDVVYQRRSRSIRDLADATVELTVVCEERATYKKGTDTVTDTHRSVNKRTAVAGGGTPRGFEAAAKIEIPAVAGGPTLDLPNNEVRWYIEAVMRGPRLPDDERHFSIIVAPVVDLALRNKVGDR